MRYTILFSKAKKIVVKRSAPSELFQRQKHPDMGHTPRYNNLIGATQMNRREDL